MLSLIFYSAYKSQYDFDTVSSQRKIVVGGVDLILGLALVIIGALSIQGFMPGMNVVAPAAVLIIFGALNLLIGVGCIGQGAQALKHQSKYKIHLPQSIE